MRSRARLSLIVAALALIAGPAGAQKTAPPVHVRQGRLLGVFDEASGEPIAGARVLNISNGLAVETSSTGTVALFFVDTTGGLLRVTKLGYGPRILFVTNSVRDTEPMTITLAHVAQALPTVVSRGTRHLTPRGPADTVQRLEDVGFYDRRYTTGAPSNAFVTAAQLHHMLTTSDLTERLATASGRGICMQNLYIDGVRVNLATPSMGKGLTPRWLESPLDMLLPVGDIAGVEMYTAADVPEEFNQTQASGASGGCATLIWTK